MPLVGFVSHWKSQTIALRLDIGQRIRRKYVNFSSIRKIMGLADVAIYNLLQSIKGNLLQLFLSLDRVFKNISSAATLLFFITGSYS